MVSWERREKELGMEGGESDAIWKKGGEVSVLLIRKEGGCVWLGRNKGGF